MNGISGLIKEPPGSPGGSEDKASACNVGDPGSIPGLGRSLGWEDLWVGKIPWRRKWQPTPVFLPGESPGQRSLLGCSPWGHTELDTTERHTSQEPLGSPLILSALWGHSEMVLLYELGSRLSPDTKSDCFLSLDFSDSKTVRNKFLLLISYAVCAVLS